MSNRSRWYERKRRLLGMELNDPKCQKCLSKDHWTWQCSQKLKYKKKESATQKLKRRSHRSSKGIKSTPHLPPEELEKRELSKQLKKVLNSNDIEQFKRNKNKLNRKKRKYDDVSSDEDTSSDDS
eukprot:257138_1